MARPCPYVWPSPATHPQARDSRCPPAPRRAFLLPSAARSTPVPTTSPGRLPDPNAIAISARRQATGLSRSALSLLTFVNTGCMIRAERGEGRPLSAAELERLDLLLSAIEQARRQAAVLAHAA